MKAVFLGTDAALRRLVEQALVAHGHALVEWDAAEGGGATACAAARAADGYVVALVGDATPDRIADVVAAGVDDWVSLPIDARTLELRLELVERRCARTTAEIERREAS